MNPFDDPAGKASCFDECGGAVFTVAGVAADSTWMGGKWSSPKQRKLCQMDRK